MALWILFRDRRTTMGKKMNPTVKKTVMKKTRRAKLRKWWKQKAQS